LLAQRSWKPLLLGAVAVGILAPATAAHAAPSAAQLQKQIQAESTKLEKIVEQYNKIGEQLKASQATAKLLRGRLGPLRAQVDSADDRVNAFAAAAYKGATLAEFSAVVSAPDTYTVVQRLVTIGQIAQVQNQDLTALLDRQATEDVQLTRLNALIADQQVKYKLLAQQKKTINAGITKLLAMRAKLYGTSSASPGYSGPRPAAPYVAGKAGLAVKFAYAQLGKPYKYAASGPGSYDCSGLTMASWKAAGIALPHNAEMQWNAVSHISRGSLQPGDLVFYSGLGHVAIYVGGNQVIHAPEPGEVVELASVNMMTPYGFGRP
jgi:cell wall-associated NlpC family hydrolase